jgi:hypothetical protein
VKVDGGTPKVVERFGDNGYWWHPANTPPYGDVATYKDRKTGYIYAWGGAPLSQTGFVNGGYVYQTRVQAAVAFDLSKYEYWHGRAVGWSSQPLTTFNPETAVMWGTGQGQLTYSSYYKLYIFVHTCKYNTLVCFILIHFR